MMLTWSTEFDSWMSRNSRQGRASLAGTDTKYPPFCLIPVWCLCHLIFGAFSTSARQATLGCATGFIFVLRLSAKAWNRKFVGKIYTLNTAAFVFFFETLGWHFLSVLWRCWLGDRKGIGQILACKRRWMLVCWWWQFDWSFARLVSSVVTTTSVNLSSKKIQNGNILVLANPCPLGKYPR